jgi:type I restriction enzyme S subunit
MIEVLHKLPEGWDKKKIGETIDIIRGVSFPKESKIKESKEGYIACLRTANVQQEVDWGDVWFIPEELVKLDEKLIQRSDILISNANSSELVGKVCQVKEIPFPATLGAFISLFRVSNKLNPVFIYYQLASPEIQSKIKSKASTTVNISNISAKKLKEIELKIPPLQEQHRIVSKIESTLSQVNFSCEKLARVPGVMKQFRQSVLAAACSGRLTHDWRRKNPDVVPVSKLLEQISGKRLEIKNTIASQIQGFPRIPKNWEWASSENLCKTDKRITYGVIKLGSHIEEGIPVLRSSDVRWLKINNSKVKLISPEIASNYSRTFLEGGEVLVTVRGSLGGVAVVPKGMAGYNISREVAVIPLIEKLDSLFFCFAIATLWSQNWLTGKTKGVTYRGINIKDLKRLPLPVPPLVEQQEIVRQVEALFKQADEIEKQVATATQSVEQITQSILAKAFRGELVPQDLPNNEPASGG